jgi:LysR family glycine cleavage system transcriptional activator
MKLPPLNALRAFEAAARTGGYASAAAELGVSAAAVSQQVRNLERFFGRRLFERHANRVALTEAGREIQSGAAEGLARIAEMSESLRAGTARARLTLSAPPSLVERWLAPRLGRFLARHPGLGIDIRVEDDPVDFAARGIDLRICYGARLYPELAVAPLFEDRVAPLAAPAFLARHGLGPGADLSRLDGAALILTSWGPSFATHPSWADWFRRKGRRAAPEPGLAAGSSSLALELARLGLGVALGQLELARADLASGALVQLDPEPMPIGHPYCAVTRPGGPSRARLAALVAELRAS